MGSFFIGKSSGPPILYCEKITLYFLLYKCKPSNKMRNLKNKKEKM